jgi:hypothetical protein
MESEIIQRLLACETQCRRSRMWLRFHVALTVTLILLLAWSCTSFPADRSKSEPPSLRVSQIVIVDNRGVERVRIGGDLPDAIVQGKRVPRGSQAAGLLLYDGTGQERGGYLTFSPSGNAALTLDTLDQQVALFVAPPHGGVALRLWNGPDEIALRADDDGAHVTATAAKKVIFQQPSFPSPETSASCRELRQLRGQLAAPDLFAACNERASEDWCKACLSPSQP